MLDSDKFTLTWKSRTTQLPNLYFVSPQKPVCPVFGVRKHFLSIHFVTNTVRVKDIDTFWLLVL